MNTTAETLVPMAAEKSMLVSLDGGETFVPATQGVRIVYKVFVPGEDDPGELHLNATTEGIIADLWVSRQEHLDHNLGTSSEMLDDVVDRLVDDPVDSTAQSEEIQKAHDTPQLPRVHVVVEGGIADYVTDEGVDVVVFDWDNYKDDPEGTDRVPSHFADLAQPLTIPVEDAASAAPAADASVSLLDCLVTVTGVPSSEVDASIPGVYDFEVKLSREVRPSTLTEAEQSEIAEKVLDCFHEQFGIDVLDDFTIIVTMANGLQVTQGESPTVDLVDHVSYLG